MTYVPVWELGKENRAFAKLLLFIKCQVFIIPKPFSKSKPSNQYLVKRYKVNLNPGMIDN